ncbi:hypothetical protein QW060_18165 [Myroides ceti]|uniref:Type II CBASS E2 protein domain-containing protein n=1 Tax=Paenimyroides ceti TaxID=395087 RepID=A0ABT8CWT3_9FLAO|nr:hypothetical protein [Paenimyroides ceti]MDN3709003.1 hypothetical protein [Paenimyroides ceti]
MHIIFTGMIKKKKLTLYNQLGGLKRDFAFGESKIINGKTLQWLGTLKSSPIGDEYKVKLIYEVGNSPKVFVLEPSLLKLADGETKYHMCMIKKNNACVCFTQIGRNGIVLNQ